MVICKGSQRQVNLGLLPDFEKKYTERHVALTYNDSGNFIDNWVNLKTNPNSPCVFSKGKEIASKEGAGIQIFRNAVRYMEEQIPE